MFPIFKFLQNFVFSFVKNNDTKSVDQKSDMCLSHKRSLPSTQFLSSLFVLVILSLSFLLNLVGFPDATPSVQAKSNVDWSNRYVIFVHGVKLPWNCGDDDFSTIRAYLASDSSYLDLSSDRFSYFHYGDDDTNVLSSCLDSFTGDYVNWGGRMDKIVSDIVKNHPTATFDVVGHSLGGTIATYWADFTTYYERIHSIIAIDSPINGFQHGAPGTLCFPFSPVWLCDAVKSTAIINSMSDSTIQNNVFCIRNHQDDIVSYDDECIGGAKNLIDLDESGYGGNDGHGAALKDGKSLTAIKRTILTDYRRQYLPHNSNTPGNIDPGLIDAALTYSVHLTGNWNKWQADWLFGRFSDETSTLNDFASVDVPAQDRYVIIHTSRDIHRGVMSFSGFNLYSGQVNLQNSFYQDVDLCFDLGTGPHSSLNVTLQSGGNMDVVAMVTSPYNPTDQNPGLFTCFNGLVNLQPSPAMTTTQTTATANTPVPLTTSTSCSLAKADPGPIVVDDSGGSCSPGGTFTMSGSANGQLSASCSVGNCRGSSTHYTYDNPNNTPDDIGTWTPNLAQAGLYEVFIDVTDGYATTTGATYRIHHLGGDDTVTINQNAHGVGSYEWISLGTFPFDVGTGGYVQITDVVPEKGIRQVMITMDAASWNYTGGLPSTPTTTPAPTTVAPTPATTTAVPTIVATTTMPATATPTPAPTITPTSGSGSDTPQPATNPDPAFSQVWSRTDDLVLKGLVARSWMWGSQPTGNALLLEQYDGKQRLVQYHDKSRMEVNDPNGDRSNPFFVTNGLLVKELISGKMQVGDASFVQKQPANVPLAGDPNNLGQNPNSPTYASLQNLASLNNDNRATNQVGQSVTTSLAKNGTTQAMFSLPADVKLVYYDSNLGHNIPDVFWSFMNNRGLVLSNGSYQTDTVVNWVYAMGYPISESYWTKTIVGGVERDVLVQAFQRRVLTYTPTNSAGFQVEMGNVGQHYYRWRYNS